jgi:hypothetical protein
MENDHFLERPGGRKHKVIFRSIGRLRSKYPPAKPGALRLLAPQRGLIAIGKDQ